MFKFDSIGIPMGSVLVYTNDTSITCIVVSPSRVSYQDKTYSISGLTLSLLRSAGAQRISVQGTKFWTYQAKKLAELVKENGGN
jgi:hypothetical protein